MQLGKIGCLIATVLEIGKKSGFFAFYVKRNTKNRENIYIF